MEASNSPFASPMMTQDSIPCTPSLKTTNTTNLEAEITQFSIKPVMLISDGSSDPGGDIESPPPVITNENVKRQRSIIKVNHADLPDAVPLLPK